VRIAEGVGLAAEGEDSLFVAVAMRDDRGVRALVAVGVGEVFGRHITPRVRVLVRPGHGSVVLSRPRLARPTRTEAEGCLKKMANREVCTLLRAVPVAKQFVVKSPYIMVPGRKEPTVEVTSMALQLTDKTALSAAFRKIW